MTYSVTRDDFNLTEALRRISQDQIDRALASLTGNGDRGEAVHDARKRLKKLRGLIRLVRPEFKDYKPKNADLRDTARLLSPLRDRTSLVETYDRITADRRPGRRTPARDKAAVPRLGRRRRRVRSCRGRHGKDDEAGPESDAAGHQKQ